MNNPNENQDQQDSESNERVQDEIKQEIKEEVKEEVTEEIKEEIKEDVKEEVKEEIKESVNESPIEESAETQEHPTPSGPMNALNKTVVVVDDDDNLREMLVYWFHARKINVEAFAKGKDALDYLLQKENLDKVSLLVLDRMLPDVEGLEILDKIKKVSQYYPPVLVLSALSSQKDVMAGLENGATEYISKPFNQSLFMQKAMRLIGL